ncbi:MAG: hypothetical protein Q9163_005512 [Psora crenata]
MQRISLANTAAAQVSKESLRDALEMLNIYLSKPVVIGGGGVGGSWDGWMEQLGEECGYVVGRPEVGFAWWMWAHQVTAVYEGIGSWMEKTFSMPVDSGQWEQEEEYVVVSGEEENLGMPNFSLSSSWWELSEMQLREEIREIVSKMVVGIEVDINEENWAMDIDDLVPAYDIHMIIDGPSLEGASEDFNIF